MEFQQNGETPDQMTVGVEIFLSLAPPERIPLTEVTENSKLYLEL